MNADAIKDFLFRHVEKFVFGLLTLLAVFLVYRGFNKPNILAEHQPDRMEQAAVEVRNAIDDDHWENLAPERVKGIDIVARTNDSIRPVNATVYKLEYPWEAKSIDMGIRRGDPELPAPIELRVTGVLATLAFQATGGSYPLKDLEPADAVEKKVVVKPKPKRTRRNMMYDDGYDESYDDSYAMEMEGYGPMGMAGVPIVPVRRIDAKYDHGFRPVGQPGTSVPATGHFIAGTALMPHGKLYKAYEAAFAQADGYNPRRDVPIYLGFELQRADVTEKTVDQLTDEDWVGRGATRYFERLLLRQWSGMGKEIVAGKYRDPKLTIPVPPVLLQNSTSFATHPKIPIGDESLVPNQMPGFQMPTVPKGPVVPGLDDSDPFTRPGMPTFNPMMQMGLGASLGYTGMYGQTTVEQPDYKLIRFYDFRDFTGQDPSPPMPGREYVYRIRIAVEDPNFPLNPAEQPRNSTLSSDVFRRVEQLTARALETKRRVSQLRSEFSEPSEPVSLPPMTQAYAGTVKPSDTRKAKIGNVDVEFPRTHPSASVVVTKWDLNYHAPLPAFTDVARGAVVSKTGVIDVPDPLALEIRKIPETTNNTGNVVVDILGGKALAISPEANQTEPGVLLMFDPVGGLQVVDEIDTQRGYRLYSAADERGE